MWWCKVAVPRLLPSFLGEESGEEIMPQALPDFIAQPWRKTHGCEIKSGSGLGMTLGYFSFITSAWKEPGSKDDSS